MTKQKMSVSGNLPTKNRIWSLQQWAVLVKDPLQNIHSHDTCHTGLLKMPQCCGLWQATWGTQQACKTLECCPSLFLPNKES